MNLYYFSIFTLLSVNNIYTYMHSEKVNAPLRKAYIYYTLNSGKLNR